MFGDKHPTNAVQPSLAISDPYRNLPLRQPLKVSPMILIKYLSTVVIFFLVLAASDSGDFYVLSLDGSAAELKLTADGRAGRRR